jgi:electron transport complex protein RnfD
MSDLKTGAERKTAGFPLLASSPHISFPVNSKMIMGNMLIALAPVSIFGVVIFGLPAQLNRVVAALAAVAGEMLFRLATRQPIRVNDFSAAVSGVLLALVIPPSMPLWMTALGAVFAVVVAKEFFGGLGANVFNPALTGRAFLLMSFPAAMTTWHEPQTGFALSLPDATSGASLLGLTKEGGQLTAPYWETVKSMFLGYRAGCTGESSILLLLAAFVYLLLTKTIDWRAPVSMVVTAFIAAFALGLDPLFAILGGGLIFGAVYMVTDYVTAPLTPWGKVIFGAGAGLISIMIRKWGNYPEGVSYAILIMNCTVPFLNKLLPRKYGYVKPSSSAKPSKGAK